LSNSNSLYPMKKNQTMPQSDLENEREKGLWEKMNHADDRAGTAVAGGHLRSEDTPFPPEFEPPTVLI